MVRIVALIAARDEADIIGPVLGDLVRQGIGVHLVDDASTDGTAEVAVAAAGAGLVGLERFEPDDSPTFSLRRIIARKQELAAELDADWFINHDADEFREGPFPGLDLRGSIEVVDRLGFDAVDFEVLSFWPLAGEEAASGEDPRPRLHHYQRQGGFNKLQIRCWRRRSGPLDLVSSAGHEAVFPGREVFPVRFLLRHYPFRSAAQAMRKLRDRRARYDPGELEVGWHRQHDGLDVEANGFETPSGLCRYDPEAVRHGLWLETRHCEARSGDPEAAALAHDSLKRESDLLGRTLDARNRELDTERSRRLAAETRLRELERSLSWRATAPLRRCLDLLRGR